MSESQHVIACDMTALTQEMRQRYDQLREFLAEAVEETKDCPAGYAFRYPSDAETCLRLAEFVTLERLCCPFLSVVITLDPNAGPLWMTFTEPRGYQGLPP